MYFAHLCRIGELGEAPIRPERG
uniref:Uncharacterized protein n=1 Tax=Romanomermis culicivorax TaxID=13658 RepID=A0A915I1Z1_ROMCU